MSGEDTQAPVFDARVRLARMGVLHCENRSGFDMAILCPTTPHYCWTEGDGLTNCPSRMRCGPICHCETSQVVDLSLTPRCQRCEYFAVLIVVVRKVRWRGGRPPPPRRAGRPSLHNYHSPRRTFMPSTLRRLPAILILALIPVTSALPQDKPVAFDVHWDKIVRVSQTTPTLQVVVNPPLRRGTPVHDNAHKALRDLGADYVRYVPWLPYPKLGVAELEPPKDGKTSWDFSLIDPMTIDFLGATKGHSVILNFSTIAQWMWKSDKPNAYPADANQVTWDYEQGTELRDPSCKEVADYYARLVGWYTQGGFTDE